MNTTISLTLLMPLLFACVHKEEETTFPEGLEPLEDNTASLPAARADEPYPEELNLISGETDEYYWTHAAGYVQASLADTWAAFATPEVVVDRRPVGDWDVTEVDPSEYDVEFIIHNVVYDIITIEFDNTWREGAVEGTADAPELVAIRWQKTAGTTYISLLEGSALLTPIDDEVTEVQLVEHLDGATSDETEIEAFLTDMFNSVVATVHGDPLPTYED